MFVNLFVCARDWSSFLCSYYLIIVLIWGLTFESNSFQVSIITPVWVAVFISLAYCVCLQYVIILVLQYVIILVPDFLSTLSVMLFFHIPENRMWSWAVVPVFQDSGNVDWCTYMISLYLCNWSFILW